MTLDERLRDRLRALSRHEQLPALDERARARVERRALAALESKPITPRRWTWGLAAAGALVCAGYITMYRSPRKHEQAQQVAGVTESNVVPAAEATGASVADAPCADVQTRTWIRSGAHEQRLELGERALLVAEAGARVAGGFAESCDVEVELASGHLSVHARKLEGATLAVQTPLGRVTVKGTVFGVTASPERGELAVSVDEGRVEVRTGSGQVANVTAGRWLVLRDGESRLMPLAGSARNRLRKRLDLMIRGTSGLDVRGDSDAEELPAAAAHDPPEMPETRVWQHGAVSPPSVAPEPKSSITEEGRPMSKPRVVEAGEKP